MDQKAISLKTVLELRGMSSLSMEHVQPDKKAITISRTFGHDVHDFNDLSEAVASYTSMAAEKLREQNSVCGYIQVYVATSRFKQGGYYSNAAGIDVSPPSAYTSQLIETAKKLLQKIYRPQHSYKKAGVILSHLLPQAI